MLLIKLLFKDELNELCFKKMQNIIEAAIIPMHDI